jgi:gamma-glutamylcyclotransferase
VAEKLQPPRPATPGERPGTEGDTLLYFGYGSNLSTARLADPERAPSAVKVGRAQLRGHLLKFHKRSNADGSSKADARWTGVPTNIVEGVVFRIAEADRPCLDYAEGAGYGYFKTEVSVTMLSDATPQKVLAYVATDEAIWNRLPFDWYVGHALAGANEHELPKDYIEKYIKVQTLHDPHGEQIRPCPHRRTTPIGGMTSTT